MKIDIVYTWVDGSDKNWLEKRNFQAKKAGKILNSSISEALFTDNDELKYSLRSINEYAPWINNIFIVTDNQIPKWLNTKNPKINIIDHSDIIDKEFLPTFNSCVIENHLHKIKKLSEHFLYFNDDMFLGNITEVNDFFSSTGKPRVFVSELIPVPNKKLIDINLRPIEKRNSYQYNMVNCRKLIFEQFGKITYRSIRHSVKPFSKSNLTELENIFTKKVNETNKNKFRTNDDIILTYLFEFYSIVSKNGMPKYLMTTDTNKGFYNLLNKIYKKFTFGFINMHEKDAEEHLMRIKSAKPFTFCINQTPETPADNLPKLKLFFEDYFPKKSPYEI
jgi:hypothetical protein